MANNYAKRLNREFKRTGSNCKIVPLSKALTVKEFNQLERKINAMQDANAVMRRRSFYCNKT